MKPPATGWLLAHFAGGFARAQPGRALVQVAAIAIGVALGAAVHLINESDLAELSAAERSPSRGLRGSPVLVKRRPPAPSAGRERALLCTRLSAFVTLIVSWIRKSISLVFQKLKRNTKPRVGALITTPLFGIIKSHNTLTCS